MSKTANPKVFISHASDDKERFVIDFATKLRAKGIDAWLDKWEMLPGDSLIDKIFEEGIKNADAFIVVLSEISVNKKWVREELDAGIINRIEEKTKLIPIGRLIILNDKLYPLDWKETTVELSREKFKHKLTRPDNSLLLEREKDLELEIPVNKKGNFAMPDSSFIEEIDANCYEKLKIEFSGYGDHEPPTLHKSKAFQGLFIRYIYVDENCDIFGEEIRVIEEIDNGNESEFIVVHIVKRPDESVRFPASGFKSTPAKSRPVFTNIRQLMTIPESAV